MQQLQLKAPRPHRRKQVQLGVFGAQLRMWWFPSRL